MIVADGTVKFTIRVYNDGPAAAHNVVIADTLNTTGYTYISHTSGKDYSNTTHLWNIDSIASGVDSTLDIIVSLKATSPFDATAYANKAQVNATDEADPDSEPDNDDPMEDDQDSDTPPIADLRLTKTSTVVCVAASC